MNAPRDWTLLCLSCGAVVALSRLFSCSWVPVPGPGPGYLGTWVPVYLGTCVPGYLGTWAPGCACRTPGSGSRTQGSDCESDSRTPESDCRTQGVRLSDPLGLRQKGPTFPGQTAPCKIKTGRTELRLGTFSVGYYKRTFFLGYKCHHALSNLKRLHCFLWVSFYVPLL